MKITWNSVELANAPKEDLIYIEGNWYFPPSSLNDSVFSKSDTPYTCPWKGVCQYFNVNAGNETANDVAWSYPEPIPSSLEIVKADYANYVAFDQRTVTVEE